MKLFFVSVTLGFLLGQAVQAMPCDTGYHCKSTTSKYEFELQRCRYINSLHLLTAKMSGSTVGGATLGPFWDGKSIGENLLAFEVDLPSGAGSSHILTVEIPAGTMKGRVKELYAAAEPEPYSLIHSEGIKCQITP
ncbi:MAG: hypothetical protein ACM3MG_08850 [Bacillota bacterium]